MKSFKCLRLVFFIMFTSLATLAQNNVDASKAEEAVAPENETFTIVDQMPEFPGGQSALMKYLSSNINYPENCRKMGVEGKVYLKFIVDKLGNITHVQVLRGVPDGQLLEKEAIRVVQSMPKWTPGKQSGKAVDVYFTLPIAFKLNNIPTEKQ
ncbi:MAG TPA: energy transducer TonB [Bacteroidia bacterium]|nr:energy transducer TonB [Bacteroidia bacterium]